MMCAGINKQKGHNSPMALILDVPTPDVTNVGRYPGSQAAYMPFYKHQTLVVGLRDCDQEPCVYGLGLFGQWYSWSCLLIDGLSD